MAAPLTSASTSPAPASAASAPAPSMPASAPAASPAPSTPAPAAPAPASAPAPAPAPSAPHAHSPLRVTDISVSYSANRILRHVSLCVYPHEIVGLVGESGSGKSTLLHAIMGTLAPSARIDSGSVSIGERNLTTLDEKSLQRLRGPVVSMVFQNPDLQLCPVVRIEKHFADTLKAHGSYEGKRSMQRVIALLESLDLADGKRIVRSYPFELSGGMRQRVCIALACVLNPAYLLADEPTSALDVATQKQVMTQLVKLRDKRDMGIVLATHNLGVVSEICDKVAVCYSGQIVEYGPANQVLQSPRHPYTQGLLAATPQIGCEAPRGMPGKPPSFSQHIEGCRFAERCPRKAEACSARIPRNGSDEHWWLCTEGAHR